MAVTPFGSGLLSQEMRDIGLKRVFIVAVNPVEGAEASTNEGVLSMSKLASLLGAAVLLSTSALVAAPAKAVPFTGVTDSGTAGLVFVLDVTTSGTDSVLSPGLDISGVTGTVGGVAVSGYSGVWGGNGDQVSSGLYLDPFQNQNPPHVDGNGTNVFTVQNPPGSGGANFEIDNIFYAGGGNHLSYQGGIGLLLADGVSVYLSADGSSGGSGQGTGGYYAFEGSPVAGASPVPEPISASLFLSGLACLGLVARKRRKAQGKPTVVG
jgi:hypothetical protein